MLASSDRFGIYVHIPYCLQRCSYCDFATFVQSEIPPSKDYIELLKKEIRIKAPFFSKKKLSTLYFGGGTPSLLPAEQIKEVITALQDIGLGLSTDTEVTIEINPATVSEQKLSEYLKMGINRFSVGAQTFNDALLKSVRREHNADQTRGTLNLLKKYNLNFSFDLLFALPGQTLDMLRIDLDEVEKFMPSHISPYCLTVPEGHHLNMGRPPEQEQIEMFELIQKKLSSLNYQRYEISNFARDGLTSKHNQLYWDGNTYWGVGLSAHSYTPEVGDFGARFWNPPGYSAYQSRIEKMKDIYSVFDPKGSDHEQLEAHQSLSDFCHISLRRVQGLDSDKLRSTWGDAGWRLVSGPLNELKSRGLVQNSHANIWNLTEEGLLLSNQVFASLTFLTEEWLAAKS